ncbi:MAG: cytochrome P450 [Myxococcota bacterium]
MHSFQTVFDPIPGLPELIEQEGEDHFASFRRDRLAFFLRLPQAIGDIGLVRFGLLPGVVVSAPEPILEVLSDRAADYIKSPLISMYLLPLIGDGILASEGASHKRHRRIVAPAFQARRVLAYADAMVEETVRHVERWGRRVDIAKEMTALTLRIVARSLFGTASSRDHAVLHQGFIEAGQILAHLMQEELPVKDEVALEKGRQLKRTVADLDEVVTRLIDERKSSAARPPDVMSMLLDARDEDSTAGLDAKELRDEVMTLFLAGHETTANALSWAWQLIADHPEVEARFLEEVDTVLAGKLPSAADLERLPYTSAVFKETLRLYPPVYFTARQAKTPTPIGAFTIPAGMSVFINIAGLHRRPELFEDPERFRPERFVSEANFSRGAYLPFGAGPRFCPGNHFSTLEGVLVLATIAQRVSLIRRAGPAEVEPLITLRPRGAVWMNAARRPSA